MLKINPGICSGCRRCEVFCSFYHTGQVSGSRARIKVTKIEALGIDCPVVCLQCAERYCAECPEAAISFGSQGQVIIDPSLCTACGTCEILCPIGAIEIHDEMPSLCDLCGGDPQCVAQCNMKAIVFEPSPVEPISLAMVKIADHKLKPVEKRLAFAQTQYRNIRKLWKERTDA